MLAIFDPARGSSNVSRLQEILGTMRMENMSAQGKESWPKVRNMDRIKKWVFMGRAFLINIPKKINPYN
jgi:hypothetical protein